MHPRININIASKQEYFNKKTKKNEKNSQRISFTSITGNVKAKKYMYKTRIIISKSYSFSYLVSVSGVLKSSCSDDDA